MTFKELIQLIQEMRQAQNKWMKTRLDVDKEKKISIERKVDMFLKNNKRKIPISIKIDINDIRINR